MTEFDESNAAGAILAFPLQNDLTRPLRAAAAKQGRPEFLSLWAGQGVRLAQRRTAAQMVECLAIADRDRNPSARKHQSVKWLKLRWIESPGECNYDREWCQT